MVNFDNIDRNHDKKSDAIKALMSIGLWRDEALTLVKKADGKWTFNWSEVLAKV